MGKHKLEEGSFKERLARSRPQFRGDIHGRNLSNEEMIKVAEEMGRDEASTEQTDDHALEGQAEPSHILFCVPL